MEVALEMPFTRRNIRHRRRTRRMRMVERWVQSQVVSSISCVAGNVATAKEYKLNVVLPDVQAGRPVVIRRVKIDAATCGVPAAAGTSFTMQCRLVGEPFSEAGNIITGGELPYGQSTHAVTVPFGQSRRFILRPDKTGNFNYVVSDSTSTLFVVWMSSLLATSAQLTVTVYYTYARDPIISHVV